MAADDTHCPYLNPRLRRDGCPRRNSHSNPSISSSAPPNPTSGDTIIGMTTLSRIVCHWTVTLDASAAPTRPPISACEDDDGRPKYHVIRFQTMAPATAE